MEERKRQKEEQQVELASQMRNILLNGGKFLKVSRARTAAAAVLSALYLAAELSVSGAAFIVSILILVVPIAARQAWPAAHPLRVHQRAG